MQFDPLFFGVGFARVCTQACIPQRFPPPVADRVLMRGTVTDADEQPPGWARDDDFDMSREQVHQTVWDEHDALGTVLRGADLDFLSICPLHLSGDRDS